MNSTFDKKQNEAVIKVALTPEEWEAELENAYNRTKGKYKVNFGIVITSFSLYSYIINLMAIIVKRFMNL